ncbi:unnamed protein product, partial [marine sediment metagenome]
RNFSRICPNFFGKDLFTAGFSLHFEKSRNSQANFPASVSGGGETDINELENRNPVNA